MSELEEKTLFSAFFFKKNGIKSIDIDIHDLDLDSEFLSNLKQSLRGGYDSTKPIIITESKNKDIDGQLIDGLHRSYALQLLYEQEKCKIEPVIVHEAIKDLDHFRARKLHYELINQSKSLIISNKKADKSFTQIMDEHPELDMLEKVIKFFVLKGFHNKAAITMIFNRYQAVEERRKTLRGRAKVISKATSEGNYNSYGMDDWASHSFGTGDNIKDDLTRQRITCQHCQLDMIAFIKADRIEKLERLKQEQ